MKTSAVTFATAAMITMFAAFSLLAPAAHAQTVYPYQSCFEIASSLHDVPVDLLLAVAATESNWDPDARSKSNAHGIMQIQWPGTARHLGVQRVAELYNPCLNIALGARYLHELIDNSNGNVERALASYNYGPTRIARSETLPAGAKAYANKVFRHRDRVIATNGSWIAPSSTHEMNRFDSRWRARRHASVLAKRIEHASFDSARDRDGSYVVTMTVAPNGLSVRDALTLETLGWSEPGS